jgi:hypothetical protein
MGSGERVGQMGGKSLGLGPGDVEVSLCGGLIGGDRRSTIRSPPGTSPGIAPHAGGPLHLPRGWGAAREVSGREGRAWARRAELG